MNADRRSVIGPPPPPPKRSKPDAARSKLVIRVQQRPFWWSAYNPNEILGMMDSHTYLRSFTREGVIEKARRRWTTNKPLRYEEVEL